MGAVRDALVGLIDEVTVTVPVVVANVKDNLTLAVVEFADGVGEELRDFRATNAEGKQDTSEDPFNDSNWPF